ncbi:MAG: hypothetical protein ABEJ28_03245 [Salinigranum sp.]
METNASKSDMGLGLSVLFSLLALGGAVLLFAGGLVPALGETAAAAGFAVAVVAALLAITATHTFP